MSNEPTPLDAASLQRRYAAGERDFHGADLLAANLRGANLHGADLHAADLRGANLRAAYLSGADLRGADLRDANLRGANLRGADLSGADLRDANLSGANLRGAQMPWIGTPAACPTLTQSPEGLAASADQIATLTRERDEARDEAARLRGDLDRLRHPLETVTMPAGDDVDREVFAEMLYHLWFQSAPTMWFDATPAVRERVLQVADQILARYYVHVHARPDGTAPLPPEPQGEQMLTVDIDERLADFLLHNCVVVWQETIGPNHVRLGATGVPPVRNYTCEISPLDDATFGKVRAATKAVFSRHDRHHGIRREHLREAMALAMLPGLLDRLPRRDTFEGVVADALKLADAFLAAREPKPADPTNPVVSAPKEPTVEGSHDHDSD